MITNFRIGFFFNIIFFLLVINTGAIKSSPLKRTNASVKKKHVQFPDEIICGKDADLKRNEEIVFDGIIIRIYFFA